ncbi:MAG: hypothetical protein DKM50_06620 [Candidatus Margulisiibacteriota bacterium]|nr:MAG: hypothetical protein A2X43_00390 [Candidatus Margulisbacteria bacterium GWD2_39_127]OGI04314.1 MAG: hypothetical protein A2X42_05285 [Candidatus Margulisbacteria bacterium GWF2_38_17]OGI11781.1 MAG: hypothetical protein A2X41_10965 [Candidatus Margulisbacteria bacterium GWE2_39_32]PZM79850.1 MAG: hypothetical protein DKM50_06620 [Candidatus Margulisiibacteriota bacterium]HAR62760.1 hypothetical protein [Candidatus Margulisiibacteriota bacterium]
MKLKSKYLKRIKEIYQRYHPLSIYLYGSYAYGTPTKDSDIDLLVITDKDEKETYKNIMHDLWDFEVPVELVVYNAEHIKEKMGWNLMIKQILKKGILIDGQAIS